MAGEVSSADVKASSKGLEDMIRDALGGKQFPIAPNGCSWQCWVEIGPDGKPKITCGIRC